MSDVPEVSLVERLRRANARLREVVAAKDAEIAALRSAKDTENAELRTVITRPLRGSVLGVVEGA